MPKIEHNAPKFNYRVSWKRDISGEEYTSVDIKDWKQNKYVVENQPTFQRYKIKVSANNELGEANVSPKEITGYSGESQPEKAPTNFTLLQIQGPKVAFFSWNHVDEESVRGHLKGYKIETWSDVSISHSEIQVLGTVTQALVDTLDPFTKNYARVFVYNGKYNGPPSDTLSFSTPEGVPEDMGILNAYPLGSSAFILTWNKPAKPNGNLIGYTISYQLIEDNMEGEKVQRTPVISDPNTLSAKLGGLKSNTKYRISITANTLAGSSKEFFIERQTKSARRPAKPNFEWEPVKDSSSIKVQWIPDQNGNSGSLFYVKYRQKGKTTYEKTAEIKNENSTIVGGLEVGEKYEFIVTSVDDNFHTDSDAQEVSTSIDGPIITPKENVATAGWFIGMMLAIAILLLVLIIVCIIKRNRGGKYAVHEREQANGRHDYPDEGGFHEYSQP